MNVNRYNECRRPLWNRPEMLWQTFIREWEPQPVRCTTRFTMAPSATPPGTPSSPGTPGDGGPLTVLLAAARQGDPSAAEELLPLVYAELRRLAQVYLAKAPPGNTFQATALVHEAYLRLVGDADPGWEGRRHFFGAAARAMRNILVDQARRKGTHKRGKGQKRLELTDEVLPIEAPSGDVLALHEALERLEQSDPRKAELVMLHHFAGLTMPEAAEAMGISLSTAEREWRFTRALLFSQLSGEEKPPNT
jgi:RNA polymerase sigma factor (TIGR02999 family)